ncbi:ornithine decarboxylase [Scheffersomyces xylosifermentans]|uniref:ornithine decarboxylase n=1 Tax=Scheffersomyces xylosifermentans TaxID=1304137 RepID=UPI00315C8474
MTPSIEVFHDEQANFESAIVSDSLIAHSRKLSLSSNAIARSSAREALSTAIGKSNFAKTLINQALIDHISEIDHEECEAGDEDSFFVCDMGEVYRSFQTWKQKLPQVHPYYAVKCNTNLEVIKLLAKLGANFDCASKNEIDTILGLGISPDRIVYANPCKTNSFIRHAAKANVNLTTVDNTQELYKLQKFHPEGGILIRIATDDETAQCRLSTKFGCTLDVAINELLPLAHQLGLNVRGVAFHVGSGAKDFDSIYKAIRDSRVIFDTAITYGFNMTVLDIGGGFELETFEESSRMVRSSLETFFPTKFTEEHGIKFIAEPGRFMVSNAFTLAAHIIARRDIDQKFAESENENEPVRAMVYINDGVYGNMNCILFDHQHPQAHVLTHKNKFFYYSDKDVNQSKIENDADEKGMHHFSIWGPTCDGLDCVSSKCALSHDVEVGDWLYFPNLGAYTSAATTSFNGLGGSAHVIYVASEDL